MGGQGVILAMMLYYLYCMVIYIVYGTIIQGETNQEE